MASAPIRLKPLIDTGLALPTFLLAKLALTLAASATASPATALMPAVPVSVAMAVLSYTRLCAARPATVSARALMSAVSVAGASSV